MPKPPGGDHAAVNIGKRDDENGAGVRVGISWQATTWGFLDVRLDDPGHVNGYVSVTVHAPPSGHLDFLVKPRAHASYAVTFREPNAAGHPGDVLAEATV